MLRHTSDILGWSHAGELAEIVDKVRLVVIPAVKCDLNPVDVPCTMHSIQNSLKPLHPAECLGSEPDLPLKEFNESTLA